jgi:hypothetical protein
MLRRPVDRAESARIERIERTRVPFATLEELFIEPAPAVSFREHGFATIEDALRIVRRAGERRPEARVLGEEREARRGADDPIVRGRDDHDALGRLHVRAQIVTFVAEIAVVKVREVAEDLDAQAREVREERFARGSAHVR